MSRCATSPCGTCPYRRSAPLGLWDRAEYDRLQTTDADFMGATFGCHLDDGSICRGWLADQKRRGVPSIRLRLTLSRSEEVGAVFKALDENDPDLYGSIAEMVDANAGIAFPEENVQARKIRTLKRRQQARRANRTQEG